MEEKNKLLKILYYDEKNPSSYSSVVKLYDAAKVLNPSITLNEVKEWLSGELTYTLHKPVRRLFVRNPIIVQLIDEQWESDLVDMKEFSKQNKGNKYIITVIDCLSKFAWVYPLKDKTPNSIIKAFKKIFKSGRKPVYLRTDQGREFLNRKVNSFLQNNEVKHFTSKNKDIKCAIIERFNRTFKSKMFKYFTANGTRNYINVLQDLVKAYNSSFHRTIKMRPVDANDSQILFKNVFKVDNVRELYRKSNLIKLSKDDIVRKVYQKNAFDKSYYPNWTDETFNVENVSNSQIKPLYTVKGKRFYDEQLQKVKENYYRIEKVIKRRKLNGKKQVFVKWLNYSNEHNSWIDEDEVKKLKNLYK